MLKVIISSKYKVSKISIEAENRPEVILESIGLIDKITNFL